MVKTIRVSQLRRIRLEPGEVLLVQIPYTGACAFTEHVERIKKVLASLQLGRVIVAPLSTRFRKIQKVSRK